MFIQNITIVTNNGDTIRMENVSETFALSLLQKYSAKSLKEEIFGKEMIQVEPVADMATKKEETYYEKRKKDPKFIEESRKRASARYHAKKNDPEFKAAAKAASKRHYEKIKEAKKLAKELAPSL
jgi:hypothetical protein